MNLSKNIFQGSIIRLLGFRSISRSPMLCIKEIKEIQNGKELTIYGEEMPSSRVPYLVKSPRPEKCSVCATGINITHTDVLILSQFVRSDGCMLPRRVTGLCNKQHRRVTSMVIMAQKAGLMPNLTPAYSKKDPKKRYQWKKYNKYFDESTIKC